MIEAKEQPIKGLKIKYNDEIYDNIMYLSISNWNRKDNVSFTSKKNDNTSVNINCLFDDIEIIKEKNKE